MARLLLVAVVTAIVLFAPATASAAYEDLLAPESVCANQTSASLSVDVQEAAMLCMVNHARTRSGVPALSRHALLMDSSDRKAQDIVRCAQFSHTACGLRFDQRIRDAGYTATASGENIAWGTGSYGTVRRTMTNWLNSTGHRTNLLNPTYRDQGIALIKTTFQGYTGAHVWVNHFGRGA
jgi:uncharacterized protein YkwD